MFQCGTESEDVFTSALEVSGSKEETSQRDELNLSALYSLQYTLQDGHTTSRPQHLAHPAAK